MWVSRLCTSGFREHCSRSACYLVQGFTPVEGATRRDHGLSSHPPRAEQTRFYATSFKVSPSNQTATPRSTASFSTNCPGTTERAGKPPRLGSQPGVDHRKLKVVRNIITASPLP